MTPKNRTKSDHNLGLSTLQDISALILQSHDLDETIKNIVDLIVASDHKGALVTIVDRKSKFTLIKKVPSKHAEVITKTIVEMLYPIRELTHTIH